MGDNVFPTRENCDPNNPEEALLWMFAGMAGDLWMPMAYYRLVSKRFWDLGARPVAEPVLELVPPDGLTQTWTDPGRWVQVDGQRGPRKERTKQLADLPLRSNCDPTKPDEAFLWMFVAPPGMRGAPLIFGVDKYRHQSRRLWELGLRPVEEPTLEYLPASPTQPDWATSAGKWVPAGSITVEMRDRAEMTAGITQMAHARRVEFFKALCADRDGTPAPVTKSADVVAKLTPTQRAIALEVFEAMRDAA